ncbi:hypothetical protein [Paludibacterium sp.]|uniref:hypothetical protein n=1 Tax=Paludibacterium sp. TaxID=1917523 RepID=UPI0025EF4B91|nr:hypothetical protein [Paludibacterium sp.]MBV8649619.1 hypothetical protein [Paludibacterium sp.]
MSEDKKKIYDVLIARKYTAGGQERIRYYPIGVAFDAQSGGVNTRFFAAPPVDVDVYIRERRTKKKTNNGQPAAFDEDDEGEAFAIMDNIDE